MRVACVWDPGADTVRFKAEVNFDGREVARSRVNQLDLEDVLKVYIVKQLLCAQIQLSQFKVCISIKSDRTAKVASFPGLPRMRDRETGFPSLASLSCVRKAWE